MSGESPSATSCRAISAEATAAGVLKVGTVQSALNVLAPFVVSHGIASMK